MHLAQSSSQGFDFSFIRVLLPFKELEHFQDFFHVVQGIAQGVDDRIDFFNGGVHGRLGRPRRSSGELDRSGRSRSFRRFERLADRRRRFGCRGSLISQFENGFFPLTRLGNRRVCWFPNRFFGSGSASVSTASSAGASSAAGMRP